MTIEDIIKYHETKAKELVEGFEALGHAQAARLLRGLSVVQAVEQWAKDDAPPAKVRRLMDHEAHELVELAGDALDSDNSLSADGHAIYAEAMRLAGIEVGGD